MNPSVTRDERPRPTTYPRTSSSGATVFEQLLQNASFCSRKWSGQEVRGKLACPSLCLSLPHELFDPFFEGLLRNGSNRCDDALALTHLDSFAVENVIADGGELGNLNAFHWSPVVLATIGQKLFEKASAFEFRERVGKEPVRQLTAPFRHQPLRRELINALFHRLLARWNNLRDHLTGVDQLDRFAAFELLRQAADVRELERLHGPSVNPARPVPHCLPPPLV